MCIDCDLLELDMQSKRADTIENLTKAADRLDDLGLSGLRDRVLSLVIEALPKVKQTVDGEAKSCNTSDGPISAGTETPTASQEDLMKRVTIAVAEILGIDPNSIVLVGR